MKIRNTIKMETCNYIKLLKIIFTSQGIGPPAFSLIRGGVLHNHLLVMIAKRSKDNQLKKDFVMSSVPIFIPSTCVSLD